MPLGLLTSEWERIAGQVAFHDARIEAKEIEYDQARAQLDDCLALTGNAHTIYAIIDSLRRRIAKQLLVKQVTVTDEDEADGEPGATSMSCSMPVQATTPARRARGGSGFEKTGASLV